MKYLKLFEAFDKESLTDLCDMCLAYLMDDGYEYEIQKLLWLDYKMIVIDNKHIENRSNYWPYRNENMFKWSDVKDTIIPLLKMLLREYRIKDVRIETIVEWENGGVEQKCFMELYLGKLLEDKLDDDTEIKNISISVMEKPKKGFIGKIKSLFEAHEEYKSTPVEVKSKLVSLIPDTFSVKVRPVLHKVSGVPTTLEVSIRKPNPTNNARSVNYNINEVLPAIEEVKELLDGRYKLTGINGDYYHGNLSQFDNQEGLIEFVTNKGRVNSGKYTFIFGLITFESKKMDEDFPLEELFACCSDEGVRITKKVGLGFLTINILLNEVSQYDDRFRYFDDVFYRQIGDAIHQCVHYYKFKLVYIQMDGSTHQNVFNAGTKFRTLEQWEALDKDKLYDGHKLNLTRISINFEL